ncbi:MAG: hypothetical protein NTU51_10490 [Bacteroidetes bacterium]|nr:hypothetical protein [Bacteroidota bacterium]
MTKFSQLGVKVNTQHFVGEKIRISSILNVEITVHAYKLVPSKQFKDKGTGQCLHLQITFQGVKRIVFTSAMGMIEAIQQIPEDKFPFETVIKEDVKRFYFS